MNINRERKGELDVDKKRSMEANRPRTRGQKVKEES